MEIVFRYKKEDLLDFVLRYLTKLGVPAEDAKIVGKVLMCADIRGVESHGLIRLGSYYGNRIMKGYIDPSTPFKVVSDTPSTALIDGANGCGQVVSHKAMKLCIEKAQKSGLGAVTVRNSNHFFMAINIKAFRPVMDFKKYLDEMIQLLKSSPLAVGGSEIYIAGEKEFALARFNEKHGVPLIKPIVEDLIKDGEKAGVPFDLVPVHESLSMD